MIKLIELTSKELEKITELNDKARNTPVILVGGYGMSDSNWNDVKNFWDELGDKYSFDPRKVKNIDRETGEIIF